MTVLNALRLVLIFAFSTPGYALSSAEKFKINCVSEVYKNSPSAPSWYPDYYCDCATRETQLNRTLQEVVSLCVLQTKNLMKALTEECVKKIGRKEEYKQQIRACVDKGPSGSVDGAYSVTDKGLKGDTYLYQLRSNNYKGGSFSTADLRGLAERIRLRLCGDTTIDEAMKIGMRWQYEFLGSDGELVGSFFINKESCRK